MEQQITHDIRYNPEHTELRFFDNDRLAASIDLRSGKAEFHGNYKPEDLLAVRSGKSARSTDRHA